MYRFLPAFRRDKVVSRRSRGGIHAIALQSIPSLGGILRWLLSAGANARPGKDGLKDAACDCDPSGQGRCSV